MWKVGRDVGSVKNDRLKSSIRSKTICSTDARGALKLWGNLWVSGSTDM